MFDIAVVNKHPLFLIIVTSDRQMGISCCTGQGRRNPSDQISNRSIVQEGQTPVYHHGIGNEACAYGFSLDDKQLGEIMAHHLKVKQREQQMDQYQKFQQAYLQLQKYYKEHDIDSCMSILGSIKQRFQKINFDLIEMSRGEKEGIELFLKQIQEEHDEMLRFYAFLGQSGWEDQGEKDGIKMYTRREDGTIGALMEKTIEVPVEIFLIILAETDYYADLIKDVKTSREEKYINRNHKIGYCVYDLPLLSERQAFFQALGYNRLNHNSTIFMYSRSIHSKPEICKRLDYTPKPNSKCVQIDYKYMILQYVPEGIDKGKVSIAVNIDMKINIVPLFIMEVVVKKFCFDFFGLVMDAVSRFKGSKWEQKTQRNPQTFNFFKEIIQQYYDKKGFRRQDR